MFALGFSNTSSASEKLTEDESRSFAHACFEAVKTYHHCPQPGESIFAELALDSSNYRNRFSYAPSRILSIDTDGAKIQTLIEVTYDCERGGNNGWSKIESSVDVYRFTCLSEGVAKHQFPSPDAFLRDSQDGKIDVWVRYIWIEPIENSFSTKTHEGYQRFEHSNERDYANDVNMKFYGKQLAREYFKEHIK